MPPDTPTRDALRRTFDQVADLYDRTRPGYPDELFDDLFTLADLRPGGASPQTRGALASVTSRRAFPADFDPFFTEIQACYDAMGEGLETWPPPRPEDVMDERHDIESSGLFKDVRVKRYLWAADYTADQYIDLLSTYSDHIALDQARRDALYADIRRQIDVRPSRQIREHYLSILHVARVI